MSAESGMYFSFDRQVGRALGVAAVLLAGCGQAAHEYGIPEQRRARFAASELEPPFVDMAWWNAGEWMVRDIGPVREGMRRWAFERPELRFILNSTEGQTLVADIGLPAITLAQTGPVTISFFVNGHPAGTLRCPSGGDRRFSAPIPAQWLKTTGYTLVRMEAHPVYIAEDGAKLGFVLYRAGFIE
jgi:hypothetical protein